LARITRRRAPAIPARRQASPERSSLCAAHPAPRIDSIQREPWTIIMIRTLLVGAFGAAFVTTAFAHVTLETQEAKTGASYKAVFRVPHGCEGTATTTIRIKIPEGVIGVKPMPKAGWTLATTVGKYPKAYDLYHRKVTEGVTEISWSGGKLPDDWYDEFVFQGFLAGDLDTAKPAYFPVVQECEKGVHRWIEIPAEGKKPSDYREPAPALRLLPATERRH
jgi:uncharacterized protein YcnI